MPFLSSSLIQSLVALFYGAICSSALASLLVSYANRSYSSSVVTAFWPVQVPITAFVSSWIWNDDKLNDAQIAAATIIVCGLIMVCSTNYVEEHANKARTVVRK